MSAVPRPTPAWTPDELARRIQHTLIRIDATRDDVERHCRDCVEYGFDAAMVAGNWLAVAARALDGSGIKLASAIDFPTGEMTTEGKVAEARSLVELGAVELDVAANIGWLRSGMEREFRDDLAAVVEAARPAAVKVMLELPLLTSSQRDRAVDLAVDAGAAWLKNASSSAVEVANPASIRYLRRRAPAYVRVKASGGIKAYDQAVALLDAGADLVGSSAGVAIVTGAMNAESY
ncbi:MAG TPA: deoxyribose-phosphate aldolase [Candidatus Limnocylindrales bacterium]